MSAIQSVRSSRVAGILLVLFLIASAPGCAPKVSGGGEEPLVVGTLASYGGNPSEWYVSPTGVDSTNCHTPANPCKTIQWAINNALSGDHIYIADGVYVERLVIGDWDSTLDVIITLEGLGANAIIEGPAWNGDEPYYGGVISIECNQCDSQVSISNLTVRKGQAGNGGLISARYGQLTLENVTFDGGTAGNGGCIFIYSETTVVLEHVNVNGCHALQSGGGIYNGGELTLSNSTISNNASDDLGGGIFNQGMATLTGNLFEKNTAERFGGGIYNQSGELTMITSTLKENEAFSGGGLFNSSGKVDASATTIHGNKGAYGGGISNQGEMYLADMTVSGNIADGGFGGGIEHSGSTLFAASLTIANNQAGGVYQSMGATMTFINTILANNSDWNCQTNPLAGGNNISSDASCNFTGYGSRASLDPLLGPLQDNGGPTWTHALLPGSPAIETGTSWLCPTTDQRGVSRPIGTQEDVGAYEFETQLISIPPFSLIATNTPGRGFFTFKEPGNCRVGPNIAFPILSSAPVGVAVPVDGRNAAGDWYLLRITGESTGGLLCWARASLGTFDGDLLNLPVRDSPPTPTPTEVPLVMTDVPTTVGIVCASYTDARACESHFECTWFVPPTGGPGSCRNKE